MISANYTLDEYEVFLMMSHRKHILVEGKDDKTFFQLLLNELSYSFPQTNLISIDIDTAEDLKGIENVLGNRQKVEEICNRAERSKYKYNIVGIVDREFREFEMAERIHDNLNDHLVQDRLVWTRGHSIENYFFDKSLLRKALRQHSDMDYFETAYRLYQNLFPSIICSACAMGIATYECEKADFVNGLILYDKLSIVNTEIFFNFDEWKRTFQSNQQKIDAADKLIQCYFEWRKKVNKAPLECVRWLCHGHIGFKMLWIAYERCMFETLTSNNYNEKDARVKIQHLRRWNDFDRLCACFNSNIEEVLKHREEYPSVVLELLGVAIPTNSSES